MLSTSVHPTPASTYHLSSPNDEVHSFRSDGKESIQQPPHSSSSSPPLQSARLLPSSPLSTTSTRMTDLAISIDSSPALSHIRLFDLSPRPLVSAQSPSGSDVTPDAVSSATVSDTRAIQWFHWGSIRCADLHSVISPLTPAPSLKFSDNRIIHLIFPPSSVIAQLWMAFAHNPLVGLVLMGSANLSYVLFLLVYSGTISDFWSYGLLINSFLTIIARLAVMNMCIARAILRQSEVYFLIAQCVGFAWGLSEYAGSTGRSAVFVYVVVSYIYFTFIDALAVAGKRKAILSFLTVFFTLTIMVFIYADLMSGAEDRIIELGSAWTFSLKDFMLNRTIVLFLFALRSSYRAFRYPDSFIVLTARIINVDSA